MKEQLINNVLNYLSDKLPEEHSTNLRLFMYNELSEYDVTQKCTDLIVPDTSNYDYLSLYLVSLRMSGHSEKTIKHYQTQVILMFEDVNKPIKEITTDDLFTHLAICKAKRNVGNRYLNGKRNIFHVFFGWLVKKKYITSNPADGLDQIKYESKIKKPYSDEEREILRCACEQERDLALIELLYSTGMRVGELVQLNRQDIDFTNMDCIVYGKGSKERQVYLNAVSCYHLKKYLLSRDDNNPALFVSERKPHNRMTEQGVRFILKKLGERAGIEKVHPHRYRATAATNALNRGMPVQDLQKLLGHEDINTTMIYCNISNENVRTSHRKYLPA